jgi:hypothetical protein
MKPFLKAFTAIILLTIGLVSIPGSPASAQIVKTYTIAAADDTLTNADTAYHTLVFDGSFKSVEANLIEITGTTGGKIVFQGQLPDGQWAGLDSVALADTGVIQFKLFTVPSPRLHAAYRVQWIKSGTGTAGIHLYAIRYTGGFIRTNNGDLNWSLYKPKEKLNRFTFYDQDLFTIDKNKLFIRRSAV